MSMTAALSPTPPATNGQHVAPGVDDLRQFVACVYEPDDIVEVRCLRSGETPICTWHLASELPNQAERLSKLNAAGRNIYFGANPRSERGGKSKEDVALARCLFDDFDGGCTIEEALKRIEKAELPRPTQTLHSGHGVHCYWRLSKPMTDLAAWTELQKGLIAALDSDKSIHDAPRIMRAPGFLNMKAEPVPCAVFEADESRVYEVEHFRLPAPPEPPAELPAESKSDTLDVQPTEPKSETEAEEAYRVNVAAFGDEEEYERLRRGDGGPRSDAEMLQLRIDSNAAAVPGVAEGSRNNAAFSLAGNIFAIDQNGLRPTKAQTLAAVRSWNERNSPPLDDRELAQTVHSALKNGTPRAIKPAKARKSRKPADTPADSGVDATGRFLTTDMGNAKRFAAQHGRDVRHCYAWGKWLVWDGTRFAEDDMGRTEALAKQTVSSIFQEAARETDSDRRDALAKWAIRSQSAERVAACIKLARSEPGIPVSPSDLDRRPWLLNCANGTVDLKTGELLPHDRAHLLTKLCPTPYNPGANPGAEAPLWLVSLERIFGGNAALLQFVQRLLGYSLVGEVSEHVLPIFLGIGSNGKSVLIETIFYVLGGDFAGAAPAELLLSSKSRGHPTELASLFGKRFVACVETGEGRKLDEVAVKRLTGGDTIKARRCHEDFWDFSPSHTLFLATNHAPAVRENDAATWRRLRLVPFNVTFWNRDKGETGKAELEADKKLTAKLKDEAPGILAWLVKGCLDWQSNGLGDPPAVNEATANLRAECDTVGRFIEDQCLTSGSVKALTLFAHYASWCGRSGLEADSQRAFGLSMTAKGFQRRVSNGVWYLGISLHACEGG